MKFLVLSACLTVSSAAPSFYGLVAHPNGAIVPADEPAVAAARADHLAAQGVVAHAAYGHAAIAPAAVAAPLNLNTALVAHPNGAVVPADEPAVVAPAAYGAVAPVAASYGLVAHPNGAVVPADEPAVVAARADHLAAKGVVAPAAHGAVA